MDMTLHQACLIEKALASAIRKMEQASFSTAPQAIMDAQWELSGIEIPTKDPRGLGDAVFERDRLPNDHKAAWALMAQALVRARTLHALASFIAEKVEPADLSREIEQALVKDRARAVAAEPTIILPPPQPKGRRFNGFKFAG